MNRCELFESLVVPAVPQAGAPPATDLAAWRAHEHRRRCGECDARAARLESALRALDLRADRNALAGFRWPAAVPDPAAEPAPEDAAPAVGSWWPGASWIALALVACAALVPLVFWLRLEVAALAAVKGAELPPDHGLALGTATAPIAWMLGALLATLCGLIPMFLSRLFCQDGQCLA